MTLFYEEEKLPLYLWYNNIGMSSSFRSFETKWNGCRVDITVVVWFWFDNDGDAEEDGKMKK